ncbi:phosphonate metabolism protein/1,5-bisphosphokinase (PRPP-forming) PhnN [Phaeovulum veldkampii]|nr:ribose 1,5-bisphosphokinase [Phaeovulum veldkampii DSM 11550]
MTAGRMTGRVFAVVGPSGAGKDTLIAEAAAARPDLHVVRRVITRPSEAGGEPFEGVTEAEFAARRARGEFALFWQAHGLHYGIPASMAAALAAGRDVVFNASRAALETASARFPEMRVIHVTAPVAELARRLAARGRETEADIAERLTRSGYALPPGLPVQTVVNDGPLEAAIKTFIAAFETAPNDLARKTDHD